MKLLRLVVSPEATEITNCLCHDCRLFQFWRNHKKNNRILVFCDKTRNNSTFSCQSLYKTRDICAKYNCERPFYLYFSECLNVGEVANYRWDLIGD